MRARLSPTRSLALATMLGLLGGVAAAPGCGGGDDGGRSLAEGTNGQQTPGADAQGASTGVEAPAAPHDVTMKAVAAPGLSPERVVLRVGSDVFPADLVGASALEGTALALSPDIDGALDITDRDELAFVPTTGFVPGQHYTATLSSLATFDQVLTPPQEGAWSASFDVPPLGLVRISPRQRDRLQQVAELDLLFSAAVDPLEVARRLDVGVDGRVVKPTSVTGSTADNVVRLRLEGPQVAEESIDVSVSIADGLPWAFDKAVRGAATSADITLADGQPVTIEAVLVKEGVDGHYIEVVCNDPAAGGERWYWDRDTWDGWDVSNRCMLAEDAQDSIYVSAGGPVSVAQGPAGFRIFGDFERGDVDLRIDAGARTVDGGMLLDAWSTTLTVPARRPRLSFVDKGRYLPRSAWTSLALEHLNVPEATLRVRHVPADNLAFWLSGDEATTARTSTLVLEQDLSLGGADDTLETARVDLARLLPAPDQGVYELTVQGKDEAEGAVDASRLLVTDLQLVAKRAAAGPGRTVTDEVWAWVLGSHDNRPVSGAEVQLLRPSGDPLATCRTGDDGGCLLAVPDPGVDPTPAMALVARKGDDLTYLRFDDVRLQPETSVAGDAYRSEAPYRAALWADRGVYRPGDVAHLAALLRDGGYHAPDGGLPVVARVLDPRRREVRKLAVQTNDVGMLSFDLPFADFATTGAWRVQLEVAEREVGSVALQVEEFVPERMAVDLAVEEGATGDGWLLGEEIPVDADARWLFGGSAAGSRVELSCTLRARPFRPGGGDADASSGRWSYGLAFVDQQAPPDLDLGLVEDRLDDEGHSTLRCPAPGPGGATLGAAELVARAAVFEGDSGRATRQVASAPVHPARHYIGLRTDRDEVAAGDPIKVEGQVVDWTGAPSPGALSEVEVRLYRMEQEYGWVWDADRGDSTYRRLLRRVQEDLRTVPVRDGRFSVDLRATASATGWLVDVRGGGARTERYVEGDSRSWYWDPWQTTVDATPRPERPALLVLDAPDDATPNQSVTVRTTAPYAGRMLLTVETDRVQHRAWRDVDAGAVEWEVPLSVDDGAGGDFAPNVYLTALLLKDPHLESAEAFLPDRAFGVTSVRLRPERFSLDVSVKGPPEARPWEPLTVHLDAGQLQGPTWATVAVVDEGILQLTDYQTPDPRDQVFARRALGVDSFETVGWTLLNQPAGPSSHTGGDAQGKGLGRVQMVKPVALWSGLVQLPDSGATDLSFDVPGYRGQLRVMAVVADADRMGSADLAVPVRDPIVLQTTLPRFLVSGDVARIPVRLTNTTDKPRDVSVEVTVHELQDPGAARLGADAGPPVAVVDAPTGVLSLQPGASGSVTFGLSAVRAPAAVELELTASAGGLRSREALQLPITNPEPTVSRQQQVALHAGSTSLSAALAGWKPGTDQTRVWVTTSPYAQALTHLGYLVRYPYGCIEQTTSTTRPLLYVRELVDRIDPDLVAQSSVDDMVSAGIERALSMQTPDGGFAYWPGGTWASEWGTAYATHMLLDAKQAGFEVPPSALDAALQWLEQRVGTRVTADATLAYTHYVLALGDRARPAQARRVLAAFQQEHDGDLHHSDWERLRRQEAEYLLMAALHRSGDLRYEDQLKRLDDFELTDLRSNDWTFWSALRGTALRLSVFQDLFGEDPAGDATAQRLADWLVRRPARAYTTQELAWSITALGKRVQAGADRLDAVALLVDNDQLKPAAPAAWSLRNASSGADVQVRAPGLDGPAWAVVSTRGVRTDEPVPLGGHGLRVSRSWVDAKGAGVDPGSLPLGTPLYVRVDVQNTGERTVQDVALVDRLPAGWEIENPRLSGADLPAWAQALDLWTPDFMNLRDDRVEVFGELRPGQVRSVLFAVRAVTAGRFVMPPVQAEAMYDPAVWARQAGRVVTVTAPWTDGML